MYFDNNWYFFFRYNFFNQTKKNYDETLKIFDFSDFINYEIIEDKNDNSASVPNFPMTYTSGLTTLDNSAITKYEAFITTKSKEIDDSSLTIPFIWHDVGRIYGVNTPAYNKTKQLAEEMKNVLEYIKNNK